MGEADFRKILADLTRRLDAQDRTIAELRETNREQAERIADLESRLKRDSRTSSRPPSSDAPWSKRRRDRKPPSGKKQGGQPGHKGTTRPLADEDDVDEVIDHEPDACTSCGHEDLVVLNETPSCLT